MKAIRTALLFGIGLCAIVVSTVQAQEMVLRYSTYLGGSDVESGWRIALDQEQNIYVAGTTFSSDFPLSNYIEADDGVQDAFIVKISSSGSALLFATYLGGNSVDEGWGLSAGSDNCAYICGWTKSLDFPTRNAYQSSISFIGGVEVFDVFITKVSSSGSELIYSTYLGGKNGDRADAIVTDSAGQAYITGRTLSFNFPTRNPAQAGFAFGHLDCDAFISKLSSCGSLMVYSTYLGGRDLEDIGLDIAIDEDGNAYVCGWAESTSFPVRNAYQSVHAGGKYDGFIGKLSSSGSDVVFASYLGGSDKDISEGISIDSNRCIYIGGSTQSGNFPISNPYQESIGSSGIYDVYISKFASSGSSLIYSTYIGGSGADVLRNIAVDAAGSAYATGLVDSTDFPTVNPLKSSNTVVGTDAFIVKLRPCGSALRFSSYFGGSINESGLGIALGAPGSIYISGYTSSYDFPLSNPIQSYLAGDNDVFVSILDTVLQPPVAQAGPNQVVIVGIPVYLDGSGSSDPDGSIVLYVWDFGDGSPIFASSSPFADYSFGATGAYTLTLAVTDDDGASDSDTLQIQVISSTDGIDQLIAFKESLGLPHGIETALDAILNAARKNLNNGKITPAINEMQAFIHKVLAQEGIHIPADAADTMIGKACDIISSLGQSPPLCQ